MYTGGGMKDKVMCLMVAVCVIVPNIAFGQSAEEAIRALKILEAKTEAGISYSDYWPALGGAKFEVNMYLDTKEAKSKVKLTESIKKTLRHYENAAKVWRGALNNNDIIYTNTKLAEWIIQVYPDMKKPYNEGGVTQMSNDGKGEFLAYPKLIRMIWKEASSELKSAAALLSDNKQTTSKQK
jgi:hypothetical protein